MRRIQRAGYSVAVAALVFVVLALPTLSRLFGPWVYIPAYAVVALVAGGLTWSLLGLGSGTRGETDVESRLSETLATDEEPAADSPEMDVEGELEDLKSER